MADPIRAIADDLAALRREVHALATAPRSPNTSVQNGRTRWLDAAGVEAVAIGVDETGEPFIRAWNSDNTAPLLAVNQHTAVFPQSSCAWQRIPTNCMTSDGWAQISDTASGGNDVEVYTAVLSLTTNIVRPMFRWRTTGTAVGRVRLSAEVRYSGARAGHQVAGDTVCETWSALSGTGIAGPCGNIGTLVDQNVTIPGTIWSPSADPAGTVAVVRLHAAVTSGAGNIEVAPVWPVHCWEA